MIHTFKYKHTHYRIVLSLLSMVSIELKNMYSAKSFLTIHLQYILIFTLHKHSFASLTMKVNMLPIQL